MNGDYNQRFPYRDESQGGKVEVSSPSELKTLLHRYFDLDELRGLCFDFGIALTEPQYRALNALNRSDLADYMVRALEQSGNLQRLQDAIVTLRPFLSDVQKTSELPYALVDKKLLLLKSVLNDKFNKSELQNLCFDLNIGYESLSGESTFAKIQHLIIICNTTNRIDELVDAIVAERSETGLKEIEAPAQPQTEKSVEVLKLPNSVLIRDFLMQFSLKELTILMYFSDLPVGTKSKPSMCLEIAQYLPRHGIDEYAKFLQALHTYKPEQDLVAAQLLTSYDLLPTAENKKIAIFNTLVQKITTKVALDDVCLDIFKVKLAADLYSYDRKSPNIDLGIVQLMEYVVRQAYCSDINELPAIADAALNRPQAAKELNQLTTRRDFVSYVRVHAVSSEDFKNVCLAFDLDHEDLEGADPYEKALYLVQKLYSHGMISTFTQKMSQLV